jgi:aminoglycoside 6'-N-acetyltransferase I
MATFGGRRVTFPVACDWPGANPGGDLGSPLLSTELVPRNSLSIRPVEARDVDAWSAMRARLWPDAEASELGREALGFVEGHPQSLLDAVFVAGDERARPIGFLELSLRPFADGCDSQPVPHVEGWYVEASVRRHGAGRALMQAAEDWARARGFCELASDTEVGNEDSRRAHEGCGFQEVERLIKFRKPIGTL